MPGGLTGSLIRRLSTGVASVAAQQWSAEMGQSLAGGQFDSQESNSSDGIDTFISEMESYVSSDFNAIDATAGGTELSSLANGVSNDDSNAWWDSVNGVPGAIGDTAIATVTTADETVNFVGWRQGQADQDAVTPDAEFDTWANNTSSLNLSVNEDGLWFAEDQDGAGYEFLRESHKLEIGRRPAFTNFFVKEQSSATASVGLRLRHGNTTEYDDQMRFNAETGNIVTSGSPLTATATAHTHPVHGAGWLLNFESEALISADDTTCQFYIYPALATTTGGASSNNTGTIEFADGNNYNDYAQYISRSQLQADHEAWFEYLHGLYSAPIIIAGIGHRTGSFARDNGTIAIHQIYDNIIRSKSYLYRGEELYHLPLTDTVHPTDAAYIVYARNKARAIANQIYGQSSVNWVGPIAGTPYKDGDRLIIPTILEAGSDYGAFTRVSGVADMTPASGKTAFVGVYVDGTELTPTALDHHDSSASTYADSWVLTFSSGALGDDSNEVDVRLGDDKMLELDTDALLIDDNGLPMRISRYIKEAGSSFYVPQFGEVRTQVVATNTVAPSVSGNPRTTDDLTVSDGTWTSADGTPVYTYQWQRNDVDISGETTNTYTILSSDIGDVLRCVVTATNAAGSTTAISNEVTILDTSPEVSVAPQISGTPTVGSALTSSTGTWTGYPDSYTYAYQWKRNGADISGETTNTYTVLDTDVGDSLVCEVTATNTAGSASTDTASVTGLDTAITTGTLNDASYNYTDAVSIDASTAFTGSNIVYSLVSPPAFVSINSGSGLITGTAPSSESVNTITVRATNSADTEDVSFSLTVTSAVASPPSVRGTPVTVNSNSGGGASATLPTSGVQSGDYRLVVGSVDGTGDNHRITGFTHFTGSPRLDTVGGAPDTGAALYRVAGGSEVAAVLEWDNAAGENYAAAEIVVQGAGGINAQSITIADAESLVASGITTTSDNCLLVLLVAHERGDAVGFTTPSGWTEVALEQANTSGTAGASVVAYTKEQASSGATGDVTLNTTGVSISGITGWLVAMEPA